MLGEWQHVENIEKYRCNDEQFTWSEQHSAQRVLIRIIISGHLQPLKPEETHSAAHQKVSFLIISLKDTTTLKRWNFLVDIARAFSFPDIVPRTHRKLAQDSLIPLWWDRALASSQRASINSSLYFKGALRDKQTLPTVLTIFQQWAFNGFSQIIFALHSLGEFAFNPTVRPHGRMYHCIPALLPSSGICFAFLSVLVQDPGFASQREKHARAMFQIFSPLILQLTTMLHDINPLVEPFVPFGDSVLPANASNIFCVVNHQYSCPKMERRQR